VSARERDRKRRPNPFADATNPNGEPATKEEIASFGFKTLEEVRFAETVTKVIPYIRESKGGPGALYLATHSLCWHLKSRGLEIDKNLIFSEEESGKQLKKRKKLAEAREASKATGRYIAIAGLTRAIRNEDYKANHKIGPTKQEIEGFVKFMEGSKYFFVNDPLATVAEDEMFLRSLYRRYRGKPWQRAAKYPGYKKDQKRDYKEQAIKWFKQGVSLIKIAKRVEKESRFPVSRQTIKNWLN
jgi:hypothetical protein